jgi:hypothetical protein
MARGLRYILDKRSGKGRVLSLCLALLATHIFSGVGWAQTQPSCQVTTDAKAFAQANVIDFNGLAGGAVVAEHYVQTHGVVFENNQVTHAVVEDEADQKVVANLAKPPYTSADRPLIIEFATLQKGVGFYLGNGNGQSLRALISAYDSSGNLLCEGDYYPVPVRYAGFVGIRHAGGQIARIALTYGKTELSESIDDLHLEPTQIRVCLQTSRGCVPAANAVVHVIHADTSRSELTTDGSGYVQERSQIENGDLLWVRLHEEENSTKRYHYYRTTAAPVKVTPEEFAAGNGEMLIRLDYPLIVYDITVVTQWNLEGDSSYKASLVDKLVKASDYFYDFTDGQMALGRVTVYQNYDQWGEADVRLYASNSLRPSAVIGGVIDALVVDPLVQEITYYPGHIFMGSAWNRFGVVKAPGDFAVDVSHDWSLALAHELGHYLLYLFDSYLSQVGENTYVETDTCTGSAMGWVYELANTEFVADEEHWNQFCGTTLGNQLLNRTEWATIRLWYNTLIAPVMVTPGPPAPPAPLTSVIFVPPPGQSTLLLTQTMNLNYVENESASPAARGFLIRNNRVIDQGKPISGARQLTLQGAQVGDRFCLFDVAHGGISRRQFGCKPLAINDTVLPMGKDLKWAPMVTVSPVTSQTIAISVTQPLESGKSIVATLYPEDKTTATQVTLALNGALHTGVFNSPIPAMSAYVSVAVDEAATPANPRREVMVDYGVGGSGAQGPVSMFGGAPVHSSDGLADFAPLQRIDLEEGEFIAWQSMAGQPPAPPNRQFVGQAYHLIGLPAQYAKNGEVAIRVADGSVATARHAHSQQAPILHYWKDGQWTPLSSEQHMANNGDTVVSSRSQGVGFYALLAETGGNRVYLPLLNR